MVVRKKLDPRYLRSAASGGVKIVEAPTDTECPRGGEEFTKNGKKYLRIVGHDSVRDLVIPAQAEPGAVLIDKRELDRMACSVEVEGADRRELARQLGTRVEQEQAESELRKRELREAVTRRDLGPRLEELERRAQRKANSLLQKAKEVRQEDEDDIKLCNKLLMATKCQAIRDAQLEEKKQIDKETEEEETRLLKLMEQERKNKLLREEKERLEQERKRAEYIAALNEQVNRNKLEREMEAERQLEESMILKEAVKKMEIEKVREQEGKKMKQEMTKMEMARLNNRILALAEEEKERAKLADLRIQELMRKKAEEEEKEEERKKQEKREKEMELAKMRAMQEKSSNEQERRDAERAKRIQEQYEKEWMERERKAVLNKARAIEKLNSERKQQMEQRQRAQALEREKELVEVARLCAMEEQLRKKEKEEAEMLRQAKLEYKSNLLKQINEREKAKIEERRKIFEEGIAELRELEMEKKSLRSLMKRKVEEVKTHNIPEQYIKEVETKLKTKTYAGF